MRSLLHSRNPRGYRHVVLGILALLSFTVASCSPKASAGRCESALEQINRDPAWQVGSVPARAQAFVGREVLMDAGTAWLVANQNRLQDVIRQVPLLGRILTPSQRLEVRDVQFLPHTGDRFYITMALGVDEQSAGQRRIPMPAFAIVAKVPLELKHVDGSGLLVVQLRDAKIEEIRGIPSFLGLDSAAERTVNLVKDLLFGDEELIAARFDPVEMEGTKFEVRTTAMRYVAPSHIGVVLEFPHVAASPETSAVPLPEGAPADRVVLGVSESSALAITDYLLRMLGMAEGEDKTSLYMRMLSLHTEEDQLAFEIQAIQHQRMCAQAQVAAVVETRRTADDGIGFVVTDTRVTDANLPRFLVSVALPSKKKLSKLATEQLQEFMAETALTIPMLPDRALRIRDFRIHAGALYAFVELHAATSDTDEP